jgi:hypothetical protein
LNTCANCGSSYFSDYTDPVDHSYVYGTCIWCGEEEEVPKDYSITWKEAYSSLGGNIAVVFKAELSKDLAEDPNAFMRFTYAGKTVEIPVSEATKSGKYHNFYCRIASINMTDDITAQMMAQIDKVEPAFGDLPSFEVPKLPEPANALPLESEQAAPAEAAPVKKD